MNFEKVNPKQSFPKLEENILKFWEENKIFEESIENRKDAEEFNFYDGPPFATGTPHYGHILAGTLKDVIPRYQTMNGKRVDRVFGWDCHGLPIENIVEKKLEISGRDDIMKVGVHTFNETCRTNVDTYTEEWKKTVNRMGRWVDMENAYHTMDTDFMESVWWVYKELYDKGLIYEGHRVVPYCPRCTTPLSNFEVNQGYKDKQDKTLTVKFKVKGNENKYILAWTTTPWTLMANLGLAVGADINYSEIKDSKSGDTYVLATDRLKEYYKIDKEGNSEEFNIIREYKGVCLEGIKYEPIFDDFDTQYAMAFGEKWTDKDRKGYNFQELLLEKKNTTNEADFIKFELDENSYSVVLGHHVTTESGTGIVHIAPAYGEDDFMIGQKSKLGFVSHIDDSGKTCNTLGDNGKYVFDYNAEVIETLKERGDVVKISTIDHSYPHCWRCDTPLIYRGISAWYVAVEKIRDKMVANNQDINWTPEVIKNGRFGKWVEGARDWNISRNRYWGSAIPVWQSEDKSEEVCIGSVKEMYELNKDFGQITKVILIRHGETDYNKKGLLDSLDKAKLTEKGISQGKELVEIFKNENIDKIYSSPLSRCLNTISYLSDEKGIEILSEDDIKEPFFGEYESKEIDDKFLSYKDNLSEKVGGNGETNLEINERVEKFYKNILEENKGKTIVICSHGGIIGRLKLLIENKEYNNENFSEVFNEINGEKRFNENYVYTSTGNEVDIHKHFVDEIKLKHPKSGTELTRIPEVLDCWFESGAMPYASKHYPFENEENFKFPADFIAEGLDQTRGWFYTLLILGTALFDKAPMKNVIVNGIVLAEDGKKMSKSLKNYPDPKLIFDKYGADAMRFYLMNSPVVEAGDFRFQESGVEEVVKKVILPLWNTYYFFTTYANIDNFKPNKTECYFVRHGQTDRNLAGVMNGGDVDTELNKTGINQAIKAGENAKKEGLDFDVIISSPLLRAKKTAELIAKETGFKGEIVIDERLKEQLAGELKDKTHDEIRKEFGVETAKEIRKIFKYKKYNKAEDIVDFDKRVTEAYKEIKEKYNGKRILIVGHSGVSRPLFRESMKMDFEKAMFEIPSLENAKIVKLNNLELDNPLDKWLISELNELTKEVRDGFDTYKLNNATRPLVKFMDNLTNWYIRRSRKRFWKSENDGDKIQAYETLYTALVELTKILAPFMPFISDHIYKELTGNKSVHLENFPVYDENLIDENINEATDKVQKIITLGLAWRANQKIRVRQPLKSITITENLDENNIEIIKEELNVKEVLIVDGNTLAKQICKPNGRTIGPKFGKDVKFIMSEAKSGNFEILENGNVKVGDFELETGDFELVFESGDSGALIEAGFGMVIAMDPEITEELKNEGYARDIVRQIQEARKEAQYQVDDRIEVSISGIEEVKNIFKEYIETETLSTIVENVNSADINKEIDLEDLKINLKLKK